MGRRTTVWKLIKKKRGIWEPITVYENGKIVYINKWIQTTLNPRVLSLYQQRVEQKGQRHVHMCTAEPASKGWGVQFAEVSTLCWRCNVTGGLGNFDNKSFFCNFGNISWTISLKSGGESGTRYPPHPPGVRHRMRARMRAWVRACVWVNVCKNLNSC